MGKETEKDQIIQTINDRRDKGEEIIHGETDHFMVIYRGGSKVYKRFGSYLDTSPLSLAYFLENQSSNILNRLNLDPDIKNVHLVEVGPKKGFLSVIANGQHLDNKYYRFGDKEWDWVRFSEVWTGHAQDKLTPHLPLIYNTAAHEAIGHSLVQPLLMPQIPSVTDNKAKFPGSAAEGLAEFIEYQAVGIDPHLNFAKFLIWNLTIDPIFRLNLLEDKLDQWSVKMGNPHNMLIHDQQRETQLYSIPIYKMFDVGWKGEMEWNHLHYPRGASLNKFILEQYGLETYKRWTGEITPENYQHIITDITGISAEEFGKKWKGIVISQMTELIDEKSGWHLPEILGGNKMAQCTATFFDEFS